MTQAARLSLRMQKELKLLLTDPPPGSSFPFLSPDSDLQSLSSIDAQLEGPEGTVYAKGVFSIKIQIPERYPFQPPSVTFATPIYHPNIDNGGRICLDILNLPPKGAWQPSLNISTVLTSIGLLLSEPNPDDGLMCEASREYKYDRQAFEQKARYMTQKYAKAGVTASARNSQCMETSSTLSMINGEQLIKETQNALSKQGAVNKKLGGFTRKLSLVCSSSSQRTGCDGEANNDKCNSGQSVSSHDNGSDVDITKGEQKVVEKESSHKKLCGTSQNSSFWSFNISQDNYGHHEVNVKPHCQPLPNSHALLTASGFLAVQSQDHLNRGSTPENGIIDKTAKPPSDSWALSSRIKDDARIMSQSLPSHFQTGVSSVLMPQNGTQAELESHSDLSGIACDASADTKRKKLCLGGSKLSLGLQGTIQGDFENKENLGPVCKLALSRSMDPSTKSSVNQKLSKINMSNMQFTTPMSVSKKSSHSDSMKLDHGQRMKLSDQDRNVKYAELLNEHMKCVEESSGLYSVIVLDSDDSEDEVNRFVVPKPVLGRQRIGNSKRKGQNG